MRCSLVLILLVLAGCSTPAPEPRKVAVVPPPADYSAHFPTKGLVKMEVITAHLLDKTFMPGGNLASYRNGTIEYQQFLGKLPDAQTAAFLLLDWKKVMYKSHYLAHMGGYFGMDGPRPLYVFTKSAWIAGVVGLPEAKADIVAREFALKF